MTTFPHCRVQCLLRLILFSQKLLSSEHLRLALSSLGIVARSNGPALEVYSIMAPHPVFQCASRSRHIESQKDTCLSNVWYLHIE